MRDSSCDVGTQVLRAHRAVEPDGQRPRVHQRVEEGLRRLAGEGAAAGVGDRAGYHQRHLAPRCGDGILDREDGGLGVEGVENGLEEQQVGAPLDQGGRGLQVGIDQLVEANFAAAGVLDAA